MWLVDLMALRGGPGLATVLPQLLRAPSVLKLGCSLSSDLAALVRVRCAGTHMMCNPCPYAPACCTLGCGRWKG